jgi:hypothetical protein
MVIEANWGYYPFVLKSGEVAEKGHMACLDTTQSGKVVKGAASTTLIPIGIFQESFTGDGTKKISVKLFQEIKAFWWDNDASSPLAASDIGGWAYIKDSHTVSADDTSRSVAGLVLAIDSAKGALIYQPMPVRPDIDT